jgi:hypothetical protein
VPEQDEIRRRIVAAKTLAKIGSWQRLAEATKLSTSTLKSLGTRRGRADEKHLRVIAAACGLPYAWFTVEDLGRAVSREDEEPSVLERLEALEHRVDALTGRDGVTPTPTTPGPRAAGDPPPAPAGELGRRLRGRATKSADPGQPGSVPEEGSGPDTAG